MYAEISSVCIRCFLLIRTYNKYTLIDSPFDEHWSSKEDRYWANDMIENGTEIYYDPDISVNHFYTQEGATWKGVG